MSSFSSSVSFCFVFSFEFDEESVGNLFVSKAKEQQLLQENVSLTLKVWGVSFSFTFGIHEFQLNIPL